MEQNKKMLLSDFEETARNHGYEVFTPEEIASYTKDGIEKSQRNELSPEDKEEFAVDVAYLAKAICVDANGKEVTRYYREAQVEWDEGQYYIEKAMRTGRYADTRENRRLARVGMPYKKKPKEEKPEEQKQHKDVEVKGDLSKYSESQLRTLATKAEKLADAAEKKGDSTNAKKFRAIMEKAKAELSKKKKDDKGSSEKGDDKVEKSMEFTPWENLIMKSANKTDFSEKERKGLAEKGEAMPNGKYPIRNEQDLHDAIRLVGASSMPESEVKAWIRKRAKALGLESKLPESWSKDGKDE